LGESEADSSDEASAAQDEPCRTAEDRGGAAGAVGEGEGAAELVGRSRLDDLDPTFTNRKAYAVQIS
jgi:hypothetical protein